MGIDAIDYERISIISEHMGKCIRKYPEIIEYTKYAIPKKEGSIYYVLNYLLGLFEEIEKYIDEHQNEISITYDFENIVRSFAKEIFGRLWLFNDDLYEETKYCDLLKQRHMAYALYSKLNLADIDKVENAPELLQQTYVGLASFYKYFYGQFKDNEEAIKLLCRYYPEVLPESLTEEELAKILYRHISNAGTPGDVGYSFHGIRIMEQYIGKLSPIVIYHILRQYRLSDIAYREIYRHQILTIIKYSCLDEEEKVKLKFEYIDFVVLIGYTHFMVEQFPRENYGIIYLGYNDNFVNDILEFNINPSMCWKKDANGTKRLFIAEVAYLKIELQKKKEGEYEIIIKNVKNRKVIKLPFLEDSWLVDYLLEKEVPTKLSKLRGNAESVIKYKQMFFSLLYLNQYRGILNQQINFEHEFSYISKRKEVKKNNNVKDNIPHFYGEKVHSLTCIVGKNGTGKTSIVDFLRETFFRLVKLIQAGVIECEQGYVAEENYQELNILDRGTEFLMVFKLDSEAYFLTNMKGVEVEEIKPFNGEIYFDDNEFSKIVYFSNMLKSNQMGLYEDNAKSKKENVENKGQVLVDSLEEFRQIDYSETDSFIRRRRILEADKLEKSYIINRELCYQFTFLKNISKEKLQEYLDLEKDKTFYIKSNNQEESFMLADSELEKEDMRSKMEDLERKAIYCSDAWIAHFSSGQYAKFTFLSKLYWFLEGFTKEKEYYNSFVNINEFTIREVLEPKDTALIFIDEGELFYHPEWQRRYINTLLEMINSREINAKLQIVITTNSPFILSDILKEDVTYLNREQSGDKEYDSPLGQNIHKLLKDNFFMDYTIGEYGRKLINSLIGGLKGGRNKNEDILKNIILQYFDEEMEDVEAVRRLISEIGEPIYRQSLEELAEKYFEGNQQKEIEYMEEKIKMLQKEVERKKAALKEENK